jgi:FkbM family methyltransferase
MFTRRLRILAHWIKGHRNNVVLSNLLRFIFSLTRAILAQWFIHSIKFFEETGLLQVKLFGVSEPLFFPYDTPRDEVDQVLCDVLKPDQWHYYEIPQTAVKSEDTVADCGAAEGLFTLTVAHRCRYVFAIEPAPAFVRALERTLAGFTNVSVLPYALAESDGVVRLSADGITSRVIETDDGQLVPARAIDSLFVRQGRRLDYLKADLEGAEVSMLRGAIETIRAYRPRIAITTYHQREHAEQIAALLKDIHPDYHIFVKGIMPQDGRLVMLHAWMDDAA